MTRDQSSPYEFEQPKRDHRAIMIKALLNRYDSATNLNTVLTYPELLKKLNLQTLSYHRARGESF